MRAYALALASLAPLASTQFTEDCRDLAALYETFCGPTAPCDGLMPRYQFFCNEPDVIATSDCGCDPGIQCSAQCVAGITPCDTVVQSCNVSPNVVQEPNIAVSQGFASIVNDKIRDRLSCGDTQALFGANCASEFDRSGFCLVPLGTSFEQLDADNGGDYCNGGVLSVTQRVVGANEFPSCGCLSAPVQCGLTCSDTPCTQNVNFAGPFPTTDYATFHSTAPATMSADYTAPIGVDIAPRAALTVTDVNIASSDTVSGYCRFATEFPVTISTELTFLDCASLYLSIPDATSPSAIQTRSTVDTVIQNMPASLSGITSVVEGDFLMVNVATPHTVTVDGAVDGDVANAADLTVDFGTNTVSGEVDITESNVGVLGPAVSGDIIIRIYDSNVTAFTTGTPAATKNIRISNSVLEGPVSIVSADDVDMTSGCVIKDTFTIDMALPALNLNAITMEAATPAVLSYLTNTVTYRSGFVSLLAFSDDGLYGETLRISDAAATGSSALSFKAPTLTLVVNNAVNARSLPEAKNAVIQADGVYSGDLLVFDELTVFGTVNSPGDNVGAPTISAPVGSTYIAGIINTGTGPRFWSISGSFEATGFDCRSFNDTVAIDLSGATSLGPFVQTNPVSGCGVTIDLTGTSGPLAAPFLVGTNSLCPASNDVTFTAVDGTSVTFTGAPGDVYECPPASVTSCTLMP